MEEAKTAGIENDEVDSSDDESIYDPEGESALRTLEAVKTFVVSSAAFARLVDELKNWLNPEKHGYVGPLDGGLEPCENGHRTKENMGPLCEEETRQPDLLFLPDKKHHLKTSSNEAEPLGEHLKPSEEKDEPCQQAARISSTKSRPWWKHYRNMISDPVQTKVPKGHARISWTCKCGDRLRIQVRLAQQQAAIAFAQQAADTNSTITLQASTSSLSATSSRVSCNSAASRPGSPTRSPLNPTQTWKPQTTHSTPSSQPAPNNSYSSSTPAHPMVSVPSETQKRRSNRRDLRRGALSPPPNRLPRPPQL
ncbi:hypothetical protein QBC38DRAFT_138454 [Podospora fimiseda]|uniref:Uncharacterized protein n=1 Tax=Podospora fimiseda TaxID=252190 RepID=A0AAN6YNH3_9PEZI|nr:hypothetical protein QBC38DRAFT_138454 [Podospora fimiseda]